MVAVMFYHCVAFDIILCVELVLFLFCYTNVMLSSSCDNAHMDFITFYAK